MMAAVFELDHAMVRPESELPAASRRVTELALRPGQRAWR
jgi:hypothetical protein